MVGILADPELYRFTGGSPPTLEELAARYEAQTAGSGTRDEAWHNWIIRLDGSAVGFVQATVREGAGSNVSADLAWVVGTGWQNRGLAKEAALAMREWLETDGVDRFSAHVHPSHAASQRVAEVIGLRRTGEKDDDGEEIWDSSLLTD